jgi:hypothetical protein
LYPLVRIQTKEHPVVKELISPQIRKNSKLKLRGLKRYASHRLGQMFFYIFFS